MAAPSTAFRQFVLKVHSRCDLACDHCYVYEHADQSWRRRPRVMPDDVVDATVSRIAEHVVRHPELQRVHVILHGGEPLLAGRARLARIAADLRAALDGVCALDLRMQTNGLLLDDDFCAVLVREGISTGISLDGDRASHDRHRKRANGTGSYDAVVRAVRLIGSPPYRRAFAGLLCTVDVANDPAAVYRALAELEPPRADFLLPHATWERPPVRSGEHPTAHARWLTDVYDLWTAQGRPFPVRLFDSLEAGRDGRDSFTEALGLGSPDLVVVETDGEIEQGDWLKTAEQDAPRTGFHVLRHSFDEAAAHPGFLAQRYGLDGLCRTCRHCRLVRICGGGLYGHRYRRDNGFDNPSVYCTDLTRLIDHVLQAPPRRPVGPAHALTRRGFDSLAVGDGDDEALRALVTAESSVRRMLLAAVCRRQPGPEAEALTRMDQRWPHRTAELLRHPYLGEWSVRSLEGLLDPGAVRQRLMEIALALALRAATDLEAELPDTVHSVHVPGFGLLTLPPARGRVGLVARRGVLLLSRGDGERPRPVTGTAHDGTSWEPVRGIVTDEFRVLLEDGDPYRDIAGVVPSPRLDDEEYGRWQHLFTEAAAHLRAQHSRRLPGIRTLLTTCTPLRDPTPEGAVTAGPRAFGALALSLPDTGARLADLLVHGVQELKFNALSDLFDLAGSPEAQDRLRSAYLGRAAFKAGDTAGLTEYGRHMVDRLGG
ncbi:FxsB family cyclophane-forming radical SAM/SPASM peptide maturase [Streptomyces sp. NPDC057456]|uniref:FxsB family cyclophane-forming radical SAM/SPASM peptide maturase n=1 Tax=Streptomyces sp. NPDC057456 TaxID=3346139 RepID=UPI0036B93B84